MRWPGPRIVSASWASEPPEKSPSRSPPDGGHVEVVAGRRRTRPRRRRRRRRASGGSRTAPRRRPSRRTPRPPACRARRRRRAPDDLGRGRLRDEQQRLRLVVGGEQLHRLAEHDPADLRGQVAPADADDLRHADAGAVEQHRRLLGARAGRGDDPDRAAPHDVREPEPDAAEHRRAAARTHHEQAMVGAAALELDLVGGRHVVGEQEHVQSLGQRAVGLEHGVLARHRDQRHVVAAEPRARRREASAAAPPGAPRRRRRRPRGPRSAPSSAASGPPPSASTAITTSPGAASAFAPSAASASRFAGVPISDLARAHVRRAPRTRCATFISRTLSTYRFRTTRTAQLTPAPRCRRGGSTSRPRRRPRRRAARPW